MGAEVGAVVGVVVLQFASREHSFKDEEHLGILLDTHF